MIWRCVVLGRNAAQDGRPFLTTEKMMTEYPFWTIITEAGAGPYIYL